MRHRNRSQTSEASSGRDRWLLGVLFSFAAGFWLWLLGFLTVGDRLAYLGYLNALGFFVSLVGIIVGVLLLFYRRRLVAYPTLLAGLYAVSVGIGPAIFTTQPNVSGKSVRVVSASLRTMNQDMHSAAQGLLAYAPDIIAVQEAHDPGRLLALMQRRDSRWQGVSKANLIVLSKFPLRADGIADGALKAKIAIAPNHIISVWTLHASPKDYANPSSVERYLAQLVSQIREQSPTIVAGDFNASPWNDGYRMMRRLLRDSFRERGYGPGFTFPSRSRRLGGLGQAFVRIDYIFVNSAVGVKGASVGIASAGADHHPVIADLIL